MSKEDTVLVFLVAYVADMQDVNMEEGLEKLNERGHAQVIDVKTAKATERGWQEVAKATATSVKEKLSSGW